MVKFANSSLIFLHPPYSTKTRIRFATAFRRFLRKSCRRMQKRNRVKTLWQDESPSTDHGRVAGGVIFKCVFKEKTRFKRFRVGKRVCGACRTRTCCGGPTNSQLDIQWLNIEFLEHGRVKLGMVPCLAPYVGACRILCENDNKKMSTRFSDFWVSL